MKYAMHVLTILLFIIIAAAWLIPNAIEWQSTKLHVCVDHEIHQHAYDSDNSESIEKVIELILADKCSSDFEEYVAAFVDANEDKYKNIINDPASMKKIQDRFKKIAVIYLSTFYLK